MVRPVVVYILHVGAARAVEGMQKRIAKRASTDEPNTKLKVRFAPAILSFLPFVWGDYWIIDLSPDYTYAVIGEPDRKYLWILSRTPSMDEATLRVVLDAIKETGYDLAGLIKTVHTTK